VARPFEHTRSIFAFALLGCACGASPKAAPRAPEPLPIVDERLEEPYLPVRTEFTVILEQPIGTRVAPQTFSARVRHPVRSPQNEIVIQSDARIHGRVIAIDDKPALHIKVRFDAVDTTWGPLPVTATIRSADPYASSMSGADGGTVRYDAALYMPTTDVPLLFDAGAVGGGPRAWRESAIHLPKGAELRLMLVRPVVAPPRARSLR